MLNTLPILYPDTVGYYHMGESALSIADGLMPGPASTGGGAQDHIDAMRADDGVSTARSVYYGAPLVLLHRVGGTWLVAFLQGLLSVAAVWILLGSLRIKGTALRFGIAMLAGIAGAAAFSATLMPDYLTGLAILGASVVIARWSFLGSGERAFWLLLILAGGLAHKAIFAVLLLLALAGAVLLRLDRQSLRPALVLGGAVGIILAGHMLVGTLIERVSGRPPLDPPFLLARVVGDGTVKRYLDQNCGREEWVLCTYRDRMPMSENDFLWGRDPIKSIYATASLDVKERILGEANRLAIRTILAHPAEQVGRSMLNFTRQLALAGVEEYGVKPNQAEIDDSGLRPDLYRYDAESGIARGTMPLKTVSVVISLCYLTGAVMLLLLVWRRHHGLDRSLLLLATVAVSGVVLNAVIHGAVAGVFDRYQGRVAWLVPLLAVCVLIRSREVQAAKITTSTPAAP